MITETSAPVRLCRCGCEQSVGARSTYRQGHDARHVSSVARQVADLDSGSADAAAQIEARFATLGSDALRVKAGRILDGRHTEALNGFGDAGIYVPFTSNPALGQVGTAREVKVGRWWYPVSATDTGGRIIYRTKTGETNTAPANSEVRDR